METLHCPTCLSKLLEDGRETVCPACRAPISRRARPLPLIERELQARIEAKTASNYRQRRRAAKVARRIASLPPTIYHREQAEPAAREPSSAPRSKPASSPTFIDLPATSVHEVRSTRTTVDPVPEPVVAPIVEPVVAPVVEPRVVAPPVAEPLADPRPPSVLRRRLRRRAVAPLGTEEPAKVEPIVALVPDPQPAPKPRFTPLTKPPRAPVPARAAPPAAPKPAPAKRPIPSVRPAPITRIGERGVNPVWRDRVFNSARRPVENARWPRQQASPELDRGRDSVVDRYGKAAG